MKMNDDNKTVAAMDVLVPGIGEVRSSHILLVVGSTIIRYNILLTIE